MRLIFFKRLTELVIKDRAAQGSPLKESRFLIPNKTH